MREEARSEGPTGWAGTKNLTGKIVLDASDPLDFSSGRPGLFVGTTDSLGERIQRLVPDAYVVKGLNIVLADVMITDDLVKRVDGIVPPGGVTVPYYLDDSFADFRPQPYRW